MKKQDTKKSGFIVSVELMLIVTILVIGLIVGLVPVRDAVVAELGDVAAAINAIDNSYSYQGIAFTGTSGEAGYISGSTYVDVQDLNTAWGFTTAPGTDFATDPDPLP